MRVLVAPDKFKGSLTGAEAAAAIAAGLTAERPDLDLVLGPVADGGDGTIDAAVARGYQRIAVQVTGPTGQPVDATFALRESTAVLEMAAASGLRCLPGGEHAPLTATTFGTGELIRAAVERGASRIVLGMGGSATTDGGAGMVAALGARFLDEHGADLPAGGAALGSLERISLEGLDPRLRSVEIVVASDVDNLLIGERGAAAVYGPQKGASAADVGVLDRGLARLAEVVAAQLGVQVAEMPGAGAAGGTAGGAVAFLGARIVSGIDLLLDLLDFESLLAGADLVVTGEGSLDQQSLAGKAPWGVAQAARRHGIRVVAFVGRSVLTVDQAQEAGFAEVRALTDIESDVERCQREAATLLAEVARGFAQDSLRATRPRRRRRRR